MPEDQELKSHRIHKEYCASLRKIVEMMRPHAFLREGTDALAEVAAGEVQPFSVAVFGRMKTGKSSLINAFIGKRLAITGVEEATATINRLTYADGEQLNTFTACWKDEPPQSFPLEALQRDWNGTTPEVLERVRRVSHLELYSNIRSLRDIHVIDTPGTGSVASEHEDVAQQFIHGQQADALVYVFAPVGRETDEEALSAFRKGCVPGSDPYNSVAIMHKWDGIFWDNDGNMDDIRHKANRLHEQMREVVADVLPVSAPLALLAKTAPDAFWSESLALLGSHENEAGLLRLLSRDSKWDNSSPQAAELRRQAREEHDLPWASFRIALRQLYRQKTATPAEARACILELSGIQAFERMLDERFFLRHAIIRRLQTRARAKRVMAEVYGSIESELSRVKENLGYLERIMSEVKTPELRSWMDLHIYKESEQLRSLEEEFRKMDAIVIRTGDDNDKEDKSVAAERWLDEAEKKNYLSPQQCQLLRLTISTRSIPAESRALVPALYNRLAALKQLPFDEDRKHASNLAEYLIHIYKKS